MTDSAFKSTWLELREPADHRARASQIDDGLGAQFATREHISVVDLGCGTGSNLRATATLLPSRQTWTLIDNDTELLKRSAEVLQDWADEAETALDETLQLRKDNRQITVRFKTANLAQDLVASLETDGTAPDLVTASAFFDLVSADFIRHLASEVTARRAVFHTALTYNGIQTWQPRHFLDNAVRQAFHRHQTTDKGFGPAAGPQAAKILADQFRLAGYTVVEDDSPWCLEPARDKALLAELTEGYISVARESGEIDGKSLDTWSGLQPRSLIVGHTDTLAYPG